MQQRRGTAEQWTTANPVLAAGEIGFETDTSKFKIGDGVNTWDNLIYFASAEELSNIIDGAPDLLNTLNELAAAIGDDPAFLTTVATNLQNHADDTTNIHGIADTSLLATTSDISTHNSDTTNVHGITDTSALVDLTTEQTLTNKTLTSPTISSPSGLTKSDVGLSDVDNTSDLDKPVSTLAQAELDLKAPLDNPAFTGTVTGITAAMVGLENVDNSSDLSKPISTATQEALDLKLNLAGGTMTGFITLHADPSQALHAATKEYVDSVASGIVAKPQVLAATPTNLALTYDNGTDGVGATLTNTVNGAFPSDFAGETGWALYSGILVKSQTNKEENGRYYISDMGSASTPYVLTRCGYCDEANEIPGSYIFVAGGSFGGTGWILSVNDPETFTVGTDDINVFQFAGAGTYTAGTGLILDGTEFSADLSVVAPINSPAFTGTVSGVTAAMVGLENVDNTSDANKPVSTATQSALDLKADKASPTFTGAVTVSASGIVFTDGTQTKEGVPSRTPIIQKTGSYTLSQASERDSLIEVNSSSATTITIPANSSLAYPVGSSIDILQTGAGQVTIAGAAGVTVNATPGLKLRTQWSSATLMKRATDSWVVVGDLTA